MPLVLKHADGREIVRWSSQPDYNYILQAIQNNFSFEEYDITEDDEIFVDGQLVGRLERE